MKCFHCNAEIEQDTKICPQCNTFQITPNKKQIDFGVDEIKEYKPIVENKINWKGMSMSRKFFIISGLVLGGILLLTY